MRRRPTPHLHPCAVCGRPVPCEGEAEANEDGWPAVICRAYHLPGGETNPDCLCGTCAALRQALVRETVQ